MTSAQRNTLAAALLGASAGMRTFTPAAVLAARGRLSVAPRVRTLVIAAAAGELVGDKLPFTPARTMPLPYLGRVASGAFCGRVLAGGGGMLPGAVASAAATYLGYRARAAAGARLRGALLEDAIAITSAQLAAVIARG